MTIYYPPGTGGAPVPGSGLYVLTSSPQAVTTAQTGTGTLRLLPWLVTRTTTIDRIGAEVTTIGDVGSKFRLGIYADSGSCYPGALLLDAGTIAGDSATTQEIAVSVTLAPGLYWIGGVIQVVTTTQPTIRVVSGFNPPVPIATGTSIPSAASAVTGYSNGGVTAALPGTFTATVSGSGSCARTFVRTA